MPHRILKFNDLISILKHKHSKNLSTSKTISSKDNIIQKSTWQKVKNKLTEFKNAGRSFSTAGHRPELAGKHPSSGWPSWGLRRMKKWRKRSWNKKQTHKNERTLTPTFKSDVLRRKSKSPAPEKPRPKHYLQAQIGVELHSSMVKRRRENEIDKLFRRGKAKWWAWGKREKKW